MYTRWELTKRMLLGLGDGAGVEEKGDVGEGGGIYPGIPRTRNFCMLL